MSGAPRSGSPADGAAAARARNVILIGHRGCGKTSVGRALAARLGWPYVDTDERIEAATGRTVQAIFARDGAAAFRRLEAEAVAAVAAGERHVISVGGGAVLAEANRRALRSAGVCVWLTAPADELYRRILADPRGAQTRPALTGLSGPAEVRHLLAQREPLYAELADHAVPTAQRSVAQVVDAVLSVLSLGGAAQESSGCLT